MKIKHLIDVITTALEFEGIPIRHAEDKILKALCEQVTYPFEIDNYSDPNIKANLLLQAYFSRKHLSPDFSYDQKLALEHAVNLVHAMIDVISSNGWPT